jgi:outer membrane receptor protein involved in Fe transport
MYDKSQDGAFLTPVADPHSAQGSSIVLVRSGTNPDLHEETALTWTAGIDLAPESVPGFTFSSTYYVTNYKDRTCRPRPPLTLESLLADDQWATLITRNPAQSQIDSICTSPLFFGSPVDCAANPPTVILDGRVRNLSATEVKGLDMELKRLLRTDYGSFEFELSGSYLFSFAQLLTRTAPPSELAGVAINPSRLRVRSTAAWHRHASSEPGFGLGLAIDYLGHSRDDENPPVSRIEDWTTFDLQLSYRTARSAFWNGNIELMMNVANLFGASPPFVNRIEGYDIANAEPYGRVISFGIQKNW